MQEIILTKRKNGMAAMLLIILLYGASIAGCIFGGMALDAGSAGGIVLFVLSLLGFAQRTYITADCNHIEVLHRYGISLIYCSEHYNSAALLSFCNTYCKQ